MDVKIINTSKEGSVEMDSQKLKLLIKETARQKNLGTFEYILLEAKRISGKGKDAERHFAKYILPIAIPEKRSNPNETSSNLSLAKDTRDPKGGSVLATKGTKLVPIQRTTRQIEGVHHSDFHAVHPDGTTTKITLPHTSVSVESEKTGKHNDEHAVIRTWNHFSGHYAGKKPNVEEMHGEIERAKKDTSHSLHISNIPKHEFTHGINGYGDNGSEDVRKRSENTYYTNMKNAAHTIHAMVNHKDFASHWKNKDILESAGRTQPELSDLYKKSGVKGAGATSKSDAITVRSSLPGHKALKLISLKDEKGSQLMSSSPAEFEGIYKHSLRFHMESGHISEKEHKAHVNTVEEIKKHLENGNYIEANNKIDDLHNKLDNKKGAKSLFRRAVHHEAITGEGKFKTKEGTASHIVTIGSNASVHRVNDFLDEYHDHMKVPRATKGKHGGDSTAVRLDTPKKPILKKPKSLK